MMDMANEKPAPKWRNFLIWSAVGAGIYTLLVWGVLSFRPEGPLGAIFKSEEVAAKLGLALIFSAAVVGFSNRNRPISLRRVGSFMIWSLLAGIVCLSLVWGFRALVGAGASGASGAMGASEWVATAVGLALLFFALLGSVSAAIAHKGAFFMDAEIADELRERGRSLFYSYIAMAAMGLALILLSLGGPGGMLSPAAALAGALVLFIIVAVLSIAIWRLMDELGRTLSRETGNMAFYLIVLLGGAWAMLGHLGFVVGPASLDWLTMFAVLMFVASFVAVGRRKLLTR
jgi:hypothetical protein